MEEYNVVILGAGPGGYVAAIRSAQLGLKTAVIEKDAVGGTCLNRGCIPTKCLSDLSHTLEKTRKSASQGISFGNPEIKMPEVVAWKNKVVTNLRNGIMYLLKSNGVTLIPGEGKLLASEVVKVGDQEIKAETIILATGSVPARPKAFPFGDGKYITSDEILNLDRIPESLAIVGGGAIGCEFASIFHSFGSKVTVYEMLPHLLPIEDSEVGRTLERSFKKRGIEVVVGRAADKAELDKSEMVLVAIGRRSNTGEIGLEESGVVVDEKGFVKTDDRLQTSLKNIYAIGDISGKGLLAYLASEQGIAVVEGLKGTHRAIHYQFIPSCVFTSPEVGTFGLTEDKIADKKGDFFIGKFPFTALGKAHCINETEGFVKIIAEKETGRIVGGQIIGPSATDLIHIVSTAAAGEGTVESVVEAVFGHPTLAESVKEAMEDVLGRAIHLPKKIVPV
ncbi:MAG: dihydrolipoyl dehydrogenase [Candidatus Omnitrophota bacterium]